jgi:polyphosphate kinase 2
MQDIMNNSASAALNADGHQHGVMVFSRETTRLGHENSAATVLASDTAQVLTQEELARLKSPKQLLELLQAKALDVGKIKSRLDYERELKKLQIELVKMQCWVQEKNKRVAIIVEGRDAAGKGGTIQRFTKHLNPRAMRVVALPVPTDEERGQWYFQRYIKQLPNRGEVVFFDRSWYNRAVVEPVNGFCTQEQYERFLRQVPEFEHMLFEDGITLIKFWFSISKEEQARRFRIRAKNPLKQWKLSPIDGKAQQLWDAYTKYKEIMFSRTHTTLSPWVIVKANNKRKARLESMRYVLSSLDYEGRDTAEISLYPDPNITTRYQRSASNLD